MKEGKVKKLMLKNNIYEKRKKKNYRKINKK